MTGAAAATTTPLRAPPACRGDGGAQGACAPVECTIGRPAIVDWRVTVLVQLCSRDAGSTLRLDQSTHRATADRTVHNVPCAGLPRRPPGTGRRLRPPRGGGTASAIGARRACDADVCRWQSPLSVPLLPGRPPRVGDPAGQPGAITGCTTRQCGCRCDEPRALTRTPPTPAGHPLCSRRWRVVSTGTAVRRWPRQSHAPAKNMYIYRCA